jgi:hypothetical protein
MDNLLTGSVPSWLAVAAATLSPLIALMVGFEGADWLLRRRLREMCAHAPLESAEGKGDCHSARSASGAAPPG